MRANLGKENAITKGWYSLFLHVFCLLCASTRCYCLGNGDGKRLRRIWKGVWGWSGCDVCTMEFATLRRIWHIISLSSPNSIKRQMQTGKINLSSRNGFQWKLSYHIFPGLNSLYISLHLPRWVTLFSLAPRPRQMKMNDSGQALSCYVRQCYLNSINRCIYECHTSMNHSRVPIACACIFLCSFSLSMAREFFLLSLLTQHVF